MNELWQVQEEEKQRLPNFILHPSIKADGMVQLTFGGCGGMYNYFTGVAAIIQKHFELENVVFSGTSGGCFPALLLSLGLDIDDQFHNVNLPLLDEARKGSLYGRWIPLVKDHFLKHLHPDSYQKASGKLFCSITNVPSFSNELVSHWESNEEMMDCILCSGYVGVYSNSITKEFRGKLYVDGGFSNNSPVPYPEKPSKVLQIWHWRWFNPAWVLVSTCEEQAKKLFNYGKEDALKRIKELAEVLVIKDEFKHLLE